MTGFSSSLMQAAWWCLDLGHVKEIVILMGSGTVGTGQLMHMVVLLQHMDIGAFVEPYQMPAITFGNKWVVVDVSVSDDQGTLIKTLHLFPFPCSIFFVLQTPSTNATTTNVLCHDQYQFTKSSN